MAGTQKCMAVVAVVAPAPVGAPAVYVTEGKVYSRLDLN